MIGTIGNTGSNVNTRNIGKFGIFFESLETFRILEIT